MKKLLSVLCAILLLSLLGSSVTYAQEETKGQLWFCWEATVDPAQEDQFMELQIEFRTHFKEAGFPYPISAWTDGMFHYYIFYPVKSYDEKDEIYAALWKAADLCGMDRMNKMWETVETHNTFYIRHLPEISYTPENPRLKEGEATFAVWDMMFVDPAKEMEFRQLVKKFTGMMKSAGFGDYLNFLIGDVGYEATAYLATLYGTSPADMWTENEKLWEMLGEEGQKLSREVLSLLKKREFKQFWYVKSLSYTPEE
ncbi:MAG: hypothetical protein ABFS28_15860 [Bacteroidota bacterium]